MFYEGIPNSWNNPETQSILIQDLYYYWDNNTCTWALLNNTANEIARHFDILILILMIMAAIGITIGIIILINQRKIKKQLRQILEQKEATSSSDQTTIDENDETQ